MSAPLREKPRSIPGVENTIAAVSRGLPGRVVGVCAAVASGFRRDGGAFDLVDARHNVSDGIDDEMGPCAEVLFIGRGASRACAFSPVLSNRRGSTPSFPLHARPMVHIPALSPASMPVVVSSTIQLRRWKLAG